MKRKLIHIPKDNYIKTNVETFIDNYSVINRVMTGKETVIR